MSLTRVLHGINCCISFRLNVRKKISSFVHQSMQLNALFKQLLLIIKTDHTHVSNRPSCIYCAHKAAIYEPRLARLMAIALFHLFVIFYFLLPVYTYLFFTARRCSSGTWQPRQLSRGYRGWNGCCHRIMGQHFKDLELIETYDDCDHIGLLLSTCRWCICAKHLLSAWINVLLIKSKHFYRLFHYNTNVTWSRGAI